MLRSTLIACILLLSHALFAQQTATVYGNVADEKNRPLPNAGVLVMDSNNGTYTDNKGNYSLKVRANDTIIVRYTFVGYDTIYKKYFLLPDENYISVIKMKEGYTLGTVTIRTKETIRTIPVDELEEIPSGIDPLSQLIKILGGSGNNELTSQYSIRGGNYDENLVYVNDFEIYRPQLVRSGQQEGLPFPNYDLISKVSFSGGGFEAKYGDKLSSVLDIQYKKPTKFEAGVTASLLGGSFYVNDNPDSGKVYYLLGVRYKTNQYLVSTLNNTDADYQPVFFDGQALVGINVSEKSNFEILGNYNLSSYTFVPVSRSTTTGVVNDVIRLDVYFDGQEVDDFITGFGGIAYSYHPNKRTSLQFLTSAYHSLETETFDIIGAYYIGQVETNLGDEDFGDIKYGLGVGGFQNFARNYLTSDVVNISHNGFEDFGAHFLRWGLRAQTEIISDELKEWEEQDSAGYSIPYNGEEVQLDNVFKSSTDLNSKRYNAYVQDTWEPQADEFAVTYGVRSSYWDLNKELIVTPRVQAVWTPVWYRKKDTTRVDIALKGAIGMYDQPPFYRELRDIEGNVNTHVKSQKSIHFLLGADYNFTAWNRDFKFISEIYYKYLYDLVPYDLDNVRIRYYGANMAKGYAAGIDLRLHGEVVEDADSWVSISLLRTMEDIEGDSTFNIIYDAEGNIDSLIPVLQGYIPRPTDQLVNVGLYFSDYMPGNENFKVNLSLLIGTGLPFGPPDNQYYRNAQRITPYRRVDIGFSALLLDKNRDRTNKSKFNTAFESLWAGVEVFNLLGIENTISYFWVKDIYSTQYAFPNFLTDRRLNVKVVAKF